MQFVYFVLAAAVAAAVASVYGAVRSKMKLRRTLSGSLGMVPAYRNYELRSITDYHGDIISHGGDDFVDGITWDDLDMDDVYRRLNVCQTSVGEEYLYHSLHAPSFDPSPLQKREALITYLDESPDTLLELQLGLAKIGKSEYSHLSSLIFDAKELGLPYPWLYTALTFLPFALLLLLPFSLPLGILCPICAFVLNVVVYYWARKKIMNTLPAVQYLSAVLWGGGKILKIKDPAFSPFTGDLEKAHGVFHKLTGKIGGLMRPGASQTDEMAGYFKILILTDLRHFNTAIRTVARHREEFHALYRSVGELDLAVCTLSLRRSLPLCCTPVFTAENEVRFEELYHPLIDDPVTNSGELTGDILVTGSNASGKSTFIKAVAINALMAQTLHTCCAETFSLRPSLVISSMAVRDDITQGDSYFVTEIKSLKRIVETANRLPCLCFVDEILKGTNTIERIAASAAVLSHLHATDSKCIVASHDIELTEMLKGSFENYHFSEHITDEGIVFDYKLKAGPSRTRNAIKLLDYMGFPTDIVENANSLVGTFETTQKWPGIS